MGSVERLHMPCLGWGPEGDGLFARSSMGLDGRPGLRWSLGSSPSVRVVGS